MTARIVKGTKNHRGLWLVKDGATVIRFCKTKAQGQKYIDMIKKRDQAKRNYHKYDKQVRNVKYNIDLALSNWKKMKGK